MLAFATQQATLLQQALPFMLPVCPKALRAKLGDVLDSLKARPAIDGLKDAGFTEQQAIKVMQLVMQQDIWVTVFAAVWRAWRAGARAATSYAHMRDCPSTAALGLKLAVCSRHLQLRCVRATLYACTSEHAPLRNQPDLPPSRLQACLEHCARSGRRQCDAAGVKQWALQQADISELSRCARA